MDEGARAWHAGAAWWRGRTDINGCSIGVELVNPGHEFGYRPFPQGQMDALVDLARGILGRHPIPARNVVGHSDVAPGRKTDPGELFDWAALAEAGVGLWPKNAGAVDEDGETVSRMLAGYGYETRDPAAAIAAFQRHFRPQKVDGLVVGRADGETAGRLKRLLELAA